MCTYWSNYLCIVRVRISSIVVPRDDINTPWRNRNRTWMPPISPVTVLQLCSSVSAFLRQKLDSRDNEWYPVQSWCRHNAYSRPAHTRCGTTPAHSPYPVWVVVYTSSTTRPYVASTDRNCPFDFPNIPSRDAYLKSNSKEIESRLEITKIIRRQNWSQPF